MDDSVFINITKFFNCMESESFLINHKKVSKRNIIKVFINSNKQYKQSKQNCGAIFLILLGN